MSKASDNNKCPHCGKVFVRKGSLAKHNCEAKKRFIARETKPATLGIRAFNLFFNKQITFDKFDKSPYYKAFVRFGEYCVNTKCMEFDKYVYWLRDKKTPVDKWASDRTYNKFVAELLLTESVADALERAIKYSIEYGEERNIKSCDILRYGTEPRIVHAINMGWLSPWVVLLSKSGQAAMNRIIYSHSYDVGNIQFDIDFDIWDRIFQDRPEDVKWAKTVLETAGW